MQQPSNELSDAEQLKCLRAFQRKYTWEAWVTFLLKWKIRVSLKNLENEKPFKRVTNGESNHKG